MLQIKNLKKKFVTGDLTQVALNGVNLNLRDNEFVAILGPSGSGKTTLLNMIGGLDHYDDGDLIINSISTKKYKSRDWDSYRNHTIGFVFQSYNLIPHQSILANVELALIISGISKKERRERAKKALEQVGLGNQLHKKPNQMSGGQMQRVAIARALINNPDILLADEPTGALDTETSIQVMEILKKVAQDRLVVMVTHNPELAEEYANRIVRLRDGQIIDDTNPFEVEESKLKAPQHKNMGKASMTFLTALSLSFNNLRTKKARTLLTSFAGSIGIIGIALILALSTGVNTYINDIQKNTMISYPITIESQSMDLSSLMGSGAPHPTREEINHDLNAIYSNSTDLEMVSTVTSNIKENNLTEFKKYLDNPNNEIQQYIGENGITYSYDVQFSVYTYDDEDTLVNTDGSTLKGLKPINGMGMPGMNMGMMSSSSIFEQLMPGTDGQLISNPLMDSYDVLYGYWPTEYNDVVLVLDKNNEISTSTLYQLGILPTSEYKKLMNKIENGEEIIIESQKWSYEEIANQNFYMLPKCDTYVKNETTGLYHPIIDDTNEIKKLLKNAIELKISGIIRPKEDAEFTPINQVFAYTKALTDYLIEYTNNSEVVKEQKKNPNVNILNGIEFSPTNDTTKINDTKLYLSNMSIGDKSNLLKNMISQMYADTPEISAQMINMNEIELAAMLDNYLENPEDSVLLSIYDNYISKGSYTENMDAFGVISLDAPSSINIYADNFEDKELISNCIEDYNETVSEENKITYTDYVALLMSSITTIINVISYVLMAFVGVSLVVSSIMIGIITYISVLERTKEIGILRAIGASKKNISQVFNAETFIIGLCSGVIGIGITLLSLIPINKIIHSIAGTNDVSAELPLMSALILIVLSVILTLIGGLIPSKKAAKQDPVKALRTE